MYIWRCKFKVGYDDETEANCSLVFDEAIVKLFPLFCNQHLKDNPFDLDELLSSLSRKQLEDLWNSLQHKCVSALLHFDEELEDENLMSSAVSTKIKVVFS